MATATTMRPLASLTMPEQGVSRLVTQVLLVVAGSLLMAFSSKISVPFWPVPMTMQTLAVFVISAAYGRNLAVATMLLYLAEGAVGFPVFSKGGGLAYLAGPTAGYLIAYPFAAAIVGWAADRGLDRDPFRLFLVMLVAEVVILGLGACLARLSAWSGKGDCRRRRPVRPRGSGQDRAGFGVRAGGLVAARQARLT